MLLGSPSMLEPERACMDLDAGHIRQPKVYTRKAT
jgi:hypothetical protein